MQVFRLTEDFLVPLLNKIYSAKYKDVEIKVNGKCWWTDNEADIIIKYTENFDDLDLDITSDKEHTAVIQAKSYKWYINSNNAIEQSKTAMEKYNAEYAIIITTAKTCDAFDEKIESYNNDENRKLGRISLINGEKLAKLYIKHIM